MKSTDAIKALIDGTLEKEFDIQYQDNYFSELSEENKKEFDETQTKIIELEGKLSSLISEEAYNIYEELSTKLICNMAMEVRYMFKKGVVIGLTDLEYLKEASNCVYLPALKL